MRQKIYYWVSQLLQAVKVREIESVYGYISLRLQIHSKKKKSSMGSLYRYIVCCYYLLVAGFQLRIVLYRPLVRKQTAFLQRHARFLIAPQIQHLPNAQTGETVALRVFRYLGKDDKVAR
jgi:hypothetical protein